MASFNLRMVMFIAMMVASIQFYTTTAQTRHVVGDAFGWGIPPNGVPIYTTWASQQTFNVGDILFFNYTNGQHDVAEVSATSYEPCNATNPISLATTGPTTLTLATAGMHYYICTFASHCQIGQKLTINVLPSTMATPPSMTPTSPPPTTTPTPPPSMTPPAPPPTTTPTPPPSMTPPSPPPSMTPPAPPPTTTPTPPPMTPDGGAPSLTAIVPATFLAIGLAFLNY
nr:hypothetical protein [Tanacetum cinerariifolium]